MLSTRSIDVAGAGVRLRLHRWEPSGSGSSGTPLFFVHANGFTGAMWRPVVDRIRPPRRSLALDLRGHGASEKPPPTPRNYSWDLYAADIRQVLRDVDTRPVHGIGHSMGGAALVIAAAVDPDLFSSLFLFEPIIIRPEFSPPTAGNQNVLAAQARRRRAVFESVEAARRRLGTKPPFSYWSPEVFEIYLATGFEPVAKDIPPAEGTDETGHPGIRLRCRPEIEAVNYEMGNLHDGFEALARLDLPVALAAGSLSPKNGPFDTSLLAQVPPDCDYVALEGRTHFAPFEDPGQFAGAVLRWIRSVESSPSN